MQPTAPTKGSGNETAPAGGVDGRAGPGPLDGLSEQEAAERQVGGRSTARASSRSYATIVRANVFTVFNGILGGFGAVTLIFGDWRDALFLAVVVANATIGITQEVRAKRSLDRLALLVAPRARVRREGREREVAVEEVVDGDLLAVGPGDQVVADGELLEASGLLLDEAILSGESRPVLRGAGAELRSGAFVLEGTGAFRVTAVGAESFAAKLTGEARRFRHPRSPLELAVNRLLYSLVALVFTLGGMLGYSLYHRHVALHTAVSTSAAGVVSLVPEGLVVLVSLTYAVAAVRMSRRGVLAQQLNAIESLASVDTICVDKTGTLTDPSLRLVEVLPAPGVGEERLRSALAGFAAVSSVRNLTVEAIARELPAQPPEVLGEVPFSSARGWSAVQTAGETLYLGGPERLGSPALADRAASRQREGRRVLALASTDAPLTGVVESDPAGAPAALGLVVLAEELRPGIRETISFLLGEGVEVKVLSGDAPETAAAIARDVGIPVGTVARGEEIPTDPDELREFALATSVIGRIPPEGKSAVVEALAAAGRYVAMVGDGVNDVPAMKRARLAIAQGSGTQMARSVADLVLIDGDFGAVPRLVSEGRRALRNLQRVAKLYVTKSAFAAFLILTIGTSSDAYPLLPRHLTLAANLTVGIPTFFLALAPSSGPWRPERFVRRIARFAVPAGALVGTGLVAGFLFARHDLDLSVADSRTVAVSTLIACGLYLVMALEAEGSRQRSTLVAGMCLVLGGVYVACLAIEPARTFFALTPPEPGMLATSLLAAAVAIAALALAGYTVRFGPGENGGEGPPDG
ncbi:MAG TPA: HAD-IC family P-type ATPase [Solirubrobacteraceae bacterium]|nr:HAD-IC family P-type ATPase [Solirubrobacteraceae bacterium]